MGQRINKYHINKGVYAFMVIICTFLVGYQYYLERIFYVMWIKVRGGDCPTAGKEIRLDVDTIRLRNVKREGV